MRTVPAQMSVRVTVHTFVHMPMHTPVCIPARMSVRMLVRMSIHSRDVFDAQPELEGVWRAEGGQLVVPVKNLDSGPQT